MTINRLIGFALGKKIGLVLLLFFTVLNPALASYGSLPEGTSDRIAALAAEQNNRQQVKKTKKEKKKSAIPLDTVKRTREYYDSLKKHNPLEYIVDSLSQYKVNLDSVNLDSISRRFFTDTMTVKGGVVPLFNSQSSVTNARKLDSLINAKNILERKRLKAMGVRRDTMSLLATTAISLVVPGFAQIRNRDYWKLPVFYGTAGGFLGLGFWAGNRYKQADALYQDAVANKLPQDVINSYDLKRKQVRTEKTLYFAGAALSYLYFLADGITNYQGKVRAPVKAGLLGLFIPGAGQIYNKSYWKLPIYYGALSALVYVVSYNSNGYNRYNNAYLAVSHGFPDEFGGRYSAEQLKNIRDDFRRNRDLSIFYTCGVYLLGVIEAYVDANFKSFDVSDNFAMRVRPTVGPTEFAPAGNTSVWGNTQVGVALEIKF